MKRFIQRFVPMYHGFLRKIHKLVHGNSIVIDDASDESLVNLRVFGKSTQNGTPTPDAPVEIVSVENPTVVLCGKNLATIRSDIKCYGGTINTTYLMTTTDSENRRSSLFPIKGGLTYTISRKVGHNCAARFFFFDSEPVFNETFAIDGQYIIEQTKITVVSPKNAKYMFVQWTNDNATYPIENCQVEIGGEATEYEEPFTIQSVSTTNSLYGIPVTSGGNYTDTNGQQWICDEVDFTRGVVIQRVKHGIVSITNFVTLSNGVPVGISKADDKIAKFKVGAYCEGAKYVGVSSLVTGENQFYENQSSFGFSGISDDTIDTLKQKYDGLRLIYVLATPIEIPLTVDQIEAYKALHTNEPNTTIYNDQDAWMEVAYITK